MLTAAVSWRPRMKSRSSGKPVRNGISVEPGFEKIDVISRRRRKSSVASRTVEFTMSRRSAPDFLRDLDDQAQLRPLLLLGELVALDRRREAALRREAELVDRDVLRGVLDPAEE